ncbi:hypothetical protein [Mesorhizobium sp. WSM2239]|uniref:Uncharacterized protein n=2 Tax=unclassified Mesorhizobium TaxID=325217 RepID=A0AAU8DEK4_9HYPH
MSVSVDMPNGATEKLEPASIFVIRDPTNFEREESPEVQSCLWGGGYRIYSIEPVVALAEKFSELKFARLVAPEGMTLLVSAERVTDRDERSAVRDHKLTRSVLCFGPGPTAPRVRVRETKEDLILTWEKLGLEIDCFE